jgi:hypothetical protein
MRWLLLVCGSLLPLLAQADGDMAAGNPKLYFMSLCLRDATVAAGRREQLCECVRDSFAYGNNAYALADAIALDPRLWEAPEKRMPQDDIGNEVRRARKDCMAAPVQGSH